MSEPSEDQLEPEDAPDEAAETGDEDAEMRISGEESLSQLPPD